MNKKKIIDKENETKSAMETIKIYVEGGVPGQDDNPLNLIKPNHTNIETKLQFKEHYDRLNQDRHVHEMKAYYKIIDHD